jgi:type II secretory pathway component PulF
LLWRSNQSTRLVTAGSIWPFSWLPWYRATGRAAQSAVAMEMLALSIEHGIPLDQAMHLAAETTGNARNVSQAKQFAEVLRRGGGEVDAAKRSRELAALARGSGLSPLNAWMVAGQSSGDSLAKALHHAADECRKLALHLSGLARAVIPAAITIVVGGAVAALFALAVFLPMTWLLYSLSQAF